MSGKNIFIILRKFFKGITNFNHLKNGCLSFYKPPYDTL